MPGIRRRIALLLALALTGLPLFACLGMPVPESAPIATQQAYSLAQATLNQGQNELDEMSLQATLVSQEMAQAAATQTNILELTQSASKAEAIAMDQAATELSQSAAATLSAYNLSVTQTAQAQSILYTQAAQTAQAHATQTAFSLTATPWAALQVDLARARTEADREARLQEYVINPLKAGLWFVAGLLLIVAAVLVFRWFFNLLDPVSWPVTMQVLRPLSKPHLLRIENSRVEVVGSSDPSVVNWIAEAEKQLRKRP